VDQCNVTESRLSCGFSAQRLPRNGRGKEVNMQRPRVSPVACGTLACLVLLTAVLARAEDGRDFAGLWEVSDVIDLGEEVGITMSLELSNFSGADVSDATVTLEDPTQPGTPYGSFSPVSILYQDRVRLSDSFTVSRSEYDSWQESSSPSFRIEFYDPAGNAVERTIEVVWMPLAEEV
jgi:hypothetical protein